MEIDESQFKSLVEQYKDKIKPIIEYNKQELEAFVEETERASAYISNHLCLPKAQFTKCLLVRNNLLAMHHDVSEPKLRTENVDYRSLQAHWMTGEVTVIDDNYSTDQVYYHFCGCTMFKSRKSMVHMIMNRYLEDYQSDEEEEKLGFGSHYDSTLDKLEESNQKDGSNYKTEVEKKLIDTEHFDKNKLSVLGKRCFEEMQSLEKDRDLTIQLDSSSSSDEDDLTSSSNSDSESEYYSNDDDDDSDELVLKRIDPELHYDEMEFGTAAETHLSDFSRWCLYGYTPMKMEDEMDEFPINCSRVEVDLEKQHILFAWCFKYDESVGNTILQKADYLSMLLNEKICVRKYSEQWTKFAYFDGLSKEDLANFVAERCENKVEADKVLNEELIKTIHYKPFFEVHLKKTVKECDGKKKLILQQRHDIIGRKYSIIYNPDDDKLYFYDPVKKLGHKEWTMELSFKECRNINKRMLDIWLAEDKKIDEMMNTKFNENMNKKLKI